jgi:hypothetical protein
VGNLPGPNARGEGGGVQLVIGVQNERDVEGSGREAARPFAGQHVQKTGGVSKHGVGLNRAAASLHAAKCRDDRADLRGKPDRLAIICLW